MRDRQHLAEDGISDHCTDPGKTQQSAAQWTGYCVPRIVYVREI